MSLTTIETPSNTSTTPTTITEPVTTEATPTTATTESAKADDSSSQSLSPQALKEITRLSKAKREQDAKIKELEARASAVPNVEAEIKTRADELVRIKEEIKKNPGKVYDLLGVDFNEAVHSYLNPTETDPEVLKLNEKVEKLSARLEAEDKAKLETEENNRAQSLNTQHNQALTYIKDNYLTKPENASRWELCSKSSDEASLVAKEAVVLAVTQLGRKVTDEEANDLLEQALDKIELEYESIGQKYQKKQPANTDKRNNVVLSKYTKKLQTYSVDADSNKKPQTIDSDMRQSSQSSITTKPSGALTKSEALAKALKSLNK